MVCHALTLSGLSALLRLLTEAMLCIAFMPMACILPLHCATHHRTRTHPIRHKIISAYYHCIDIQRRSSDVTEHKSEARSGAPPKSLRNGSVEGFKKYSSKEIYKVYMQGFKAVDPKCTCEA